MQAFDAFLEPLIKAGLLEVAGVDTNEIALGGDLPVQAGRGLSDAWQRILVHVAPDYFLHDPPPAVMPLGSANLWKISRIFSGLKSITTLF